MVGLYIHIPFCKSRCIYCDFYSTSSTKKIDEYVKILCQEITLKRDLLGKTPFISSIYFGGGTPSLLSPQHIETILCSIKRSYYTDLKGIEITLEANPDDITWNYVQALSDMGINRISLGVQSFNQKLLDLLGRRHNTEQVIKALETIRNVGIENISLDLIYGLPNDTFESWEKSLNQTISLIPSHISAYALTYEEGTRLSYLTKKGILSIKSEEEIEREYQLLTQKLYSAGYSHYEISNFALPNREAKHNSAYWSRTPYLGFGPSSHSYLKITKETPINGIICKENDEIRFANLSQLSTYKKEITQGKYPLSFIEKLSQKDRYNEIIMLRLRTKKGLNVKELEKEFGVFPTKHLLSESQQYIEQGLLCHKGNYIAPTEKGFFLIDGIIASLFIE